MTDLNTQALNVSRTQNHFYQLSATGMRPNTIHNIFIDGEDYGYATRQFGKAPGEDLISDADGNMTFGILYEIEFNRNRNFELPQGQTLSFQDDIVNQQESRQASKVVINNKIIELISPDGQSQTQLVLALNIILTAGPVNQLFPIE